LYCSAYKYFSTHMGVLYGRLPLLESLAAYKSAQRKTLHPKWETGRSTTNACGAGRDAEYLAVSAMSAMRIMHGDLQAWREDALTCIARWRRFRITSVYYQTDCSADWRLSQISASTA
jgi:hypothetical protein